MHRVLLASLLVLAVTACAAPDPERFEQPVEGGVLVRVIDAEGRVIPGAEVRASLDGYDPKLVAEYLFASPLGRVDRFGARWLTDARGETRVSARASVDPIVARSGDRWGVSRAEYVVVPDRLVFGDPDAAAAGSPVEDAPEVEESLARTIVLERDESIRVTCRDHDGRPGIGAFVMVSLVGPNGSDGGQTRWSDFVRSSDGTLDVPHAQFWRALRAQGFEVSIVAAVLLSDEMAEDTSKPFPDSTEDELAFEVSSSGSIEIRAEWCSADTMGDLRWIDAPLDTEDPDDIPELPINPSRSLPFSVPLGLRFEIVVPVPGLADARLAFDGPKRPGERVEIVLPRPGPVAQVTGRLIDANGSALVRHEFDVHLDRDGSRIEPEESWLVTQDDGRFAFELPPGIHGALHFELTGSVMGPGPELTFTLSLSSDPQPPRPSARVELTSDLPAGVFDVGDIVCAAPR